MDSCIVEQILNRQIDAAIIYEDDQFISFLDHRPVFYGHALVCPKLHVATLYDLPPELTGSLFTVVQKIGKAIEQATNAGGSFVAMNNIISQSVPHLHVHVIPRSKGDGLKGFFWPRLKYQDGEHMKKIQEAIIALL